MPIAGVRLFIYPLAGKRGSEWRIMAAKTPVAMPSVFSGPTADEM
jgi:hypothetical protein